MCRSERQLEQCYSERQLYEAALDRMARAISAVRRIEETTAVTEIENVLEKFSRAATRARRVPRSGPPPRPAIPPSHPARLSD
jgi:hypothetical protein